MKRPATAVIGIAALSAVAMALAGGCPAEMVPCDMAVAGAACEDGTIGANDEANTDNAEQNAPETQNVDDQTRILTDEEVQRQDEIERRRDARGDAAGTPTTGNDNSGSGTRRRGERGTDANENTNENENSNSDDVPPVRRRRG